MTPTSFASRQRSGRDDDELERFKVAVNLTELAAGLGYQLESPKHGTSRGSICMRRPADDDKVIIRRAEDGHWTYFSVRDDRDNGTVIDFLQRRRGLTLGAVRKELRAWLRVDRPPVAPALFRRDVEAHGQDLESVVARFAAARQVRTAGYLISRGLLPATLGDDRFRGTFRVEHRGNVLFPHLHDGHVVGFEIKAPAFTGFSPGGRKTCWSSVVRQTDQRLVVVEAPIDAFSYHQLHPDEKSRYLSTGGAVGAGQLGDIRRHIESLPRGGVVVIATDADAAGDKLARQIEAVAGGIHCRRHRPPAGKDWNDYLRAREHHRAHPELDR